MFILTIIFGVVIFAIFSVFLYVHWLQQYSRMGKYVQKFPYMEKFKPVSGHIWEFSRKPDILYKTFRKRNVLFKETFIHWTAYVPTFNIIRADDAEIVLSNVKYIEKGLTYMLLDRWLKTGLLTSTGSKWHQRRKMLTPAFHYNILQMFIEVFGEQCEIFTKVLQEECKKPKVDIFPLIAMATLSTICETSMGVKLERNNRYLSKYYDSLRRLGEVYLERIFSPWLFPEFLYMFSPQYREEIELVKYLHKFTSDIIKTREKTFDYQDVVDLDSIGHRPKRRLAMLDLLLYSKIEGKIDDAGIQEEVDTFVFEGHDTTTAGICFALLSIANETVIQNKIIEELDYIFGESKRHATYDDLQNMRYLDCCIKESLRLYPPVPQILRQITEDVPLTHNIAPAGAELLLHIHDIHRDPKYYPDPEKFDPDRFLPENCKGRPPYAYIPFSAGPRNCIGQKFAMLEIKSIVSTILRNFKMEAVVAPKDLTFCMNLVLRVKDKMYIKFIPRNNIDIL